MEHYAGQIEFLAKLYQAQVDGGRYFLHGQKGEFVHGSQPPLEEYLEDDEECSTTTTDIGQRPHQRGVSQSDG